MITNAENKGKDDKSYSEIVSHHVYFMAFNQIHVLSVVFVAKWFAKGTKREIRVVTSF
jgi:hypothetical protein